jgi:hypothetical protein
VVCCKFVISVPHVETRRVLALSILVDLPSFGEVRRNVRFVRNRYRAVTRYAVSREAVCYDAVCCDVVCCKFVARVSHIETRRASTLSIFVDL